MNGQYCGCLNCEYVRATKEPLDFWDEEQDDGWEDEVYDEKE